MQKQAGGEGVNFASVAAALGIVLLLGGWLAWAAGVGAPPMPSLRQNMTLTAAVFPTLDSTALMGEILETPFYYGLLPLTPVPASTATPSAADQIEATQTRMFGVGSFPTPAPTQTLMPGECYVGDNDPCWQVYVQEGLSPEQYWNLWTPQVATAIPTLRTFVTWTPTPDLSALEQEIQATIHVMAQATALALTPTAHAEERSDEPSSEERVPQAARQATEMD